jgi:hypothetical protein
LICLNGSSSRVVRLKQIEVFGTVGTAGTYNFYLVKRAMADTGGTLATGLALPNPYPYDSTFPAPSATMVSYTGNPTINDMMPGIISGMTVSFSTTGSTGNSGSPGGLGIGIISDVGTASPTLRGANQQLCINGNGVTFPANPLISFSFTWTEAAQ